MTTAATLRRLESEARASIESAFASNEEPPRSEVENNHCPECQETAARFAGRPASAISAALLLVEPRPSIALLTPAAFRYYLPALMLACIEAPLELDVVPDELIGRLSPTGAKSRDEPSNDIHFSGAQAGAILAFLRVFELRQRIASALPEDALEFAPLTRPLARAIRYWSMRAASSASPTLSVPRR